MNPRVPFVFALCLFLLTTGCLDALTNSSNSGKFWGEDCEDSKGRQFVSRAYALEDTITEMCQQLDNRVIERCVAIAKRRLGEVERSEED